MKMTPEQYTALKADIHAIAIHCRLTITQKTDPVTLWYATMEVNAQRSYGDDHPRWTKTKRVLPASHVDSQCWLADFYNKGLNDAHIMTALKKIVQEAP
jgi:hypothetical protein